MIRDTDGKGHTHVGSRDMASHSIVILHPSFRPRCQCQCQCQCRMDHHHMKNGLTTTDDAPWRVQRKKGRFLGSLESLQDNWQLPSGSRASGLFQLHRTLLPSNSFPNTVNGHGIDPFDVSLRIPSGCSSPALAAWWIQRVTHLLGSPPDSLGPPSGDIRASGLEPSSPFT
ncbi:uncharacterized protein BO80DRAFT_89220 [Aspergillus ibericus CBS 121593]|uniref:Uncharacterized protein n=1 Tax=Aspergillus ibericus CBS 121593 TaxID=1448316 RepID=A0A395GZ34_9EURO|nr:hypothetical protein BO80DRAFT_89220 [Aspergillus ibericus CBS 121593]RAL00882.1 hypothetical protein BO80DRAFT_89220 [Aspergillus ibericus CBS 121593]